MSAENPVEVLTRWESFGGTWRVLRRNGARVTISMRRCDGGEQVEELISDDPALPPGCAATAISAVRSRGRARAPVVLLRAVAVAALARVAPAAGLVAGGVEEDPAARRPGALLDAGELRTAEQEYRRDRGLQEGEVQPGLRPAQPVAVPAGAETQGGQPAAGQLLDRRELRFGRGLAAACAANTASSCSRRWRALDRTRSASAGRSAAARPERVDVRKPAGALGELEQIRVGVQVLLRVGPRRQYTELTNARQSRPPRKWDVASAPSNETASGAIASR